MSVKKSKDVTSGPPVPGVAYSYLRFSAAKQAEGDSVRRQTDAAVAWCERNNVRLDTTLVFADRGRSAFKHHHKDREALSEFRRLVASGRIASGSFLLIENLDRLSREEERIAVELLLSIVNNGITVVQLMPEEQVFSPSNLDMLGLMRAVIQLAQAHQESAKRASRLGEVWAQKRTAAVEGRGMLTSRVPGWIELRDGEMRLIPERAELVRRLFKLALAGYGSQAVARLLNKEKVPTMTGRGRWYSSAVVHILRSESTYGKHQPYTVHGREKREPIGEPIEDYYPAVVTRKEYLAVQAVIDQRGGMRGRPPKKHFNIFRSLLKDARNGGAIGVNYSRWEGGQKRVYANSDRVAGLPQRTFPADVFDAAVLKLLREVDPREVIGESAAAEQVLTLTGEREQLAGRIQRTLDALGNTDSPAIVARVTAWEAQLRDIDRQLTEARQQAANPLAASWGELPSLIEAASTEDGRIRLSAILRRILTQVRCLFIPRGRVRCAVVQMFFREGKARSYVVAYSQAAPAGSGKGRKMNPERWAVRSLLEVGGPTKVDLRDPASVANIETTFAVLPLHALLTTESTTQKVKK